MKALAPALARLALILCSFASLSTIARSEGGTYEVDKLKGDVQTWAPKRQQWLSVQMKDRIAEGALLQLDQNAMIRVKGVEIAGRIPKGFSVRAQNPMVIRLERQSFRRFRLGGYHVPLPPKKKDAAKIEPEVEAPQANFLTAAWEQAVSVFDDSEVDPDATAQETQSIKSGEQNPSDVRADNSEVFNIIHPKMGSNLFVGSLPTTVVVIWDDLNVLFPEKNSHQYELTFWRDIEKTATPVAVTENDRVKFEVNAEGRYYMRVQTLDGRFRSGVYSFTINEL